MTRMFTPCACSRADRSTRRGRSTACRSPRVLVHSSTRALWAMGTAGCSPRGRTRETVRHTDLYAQHLLVNGSIASGWAANGIPVCTAAGAQLNPTIATDISGGIFVAWEDPRGGTSGYLRAPCPRQRHDRSRVAGRWPCRLYGVRKSDASSGPWRRSRRRIYRVDGRPSQDPSHRCSRSTCLLPARSTPFGRRRTSTSALRSAITSNLVLRPDGSGGSLAIWDDHRAAGCTFTRITSSSPERWTPHGPQTAAPWPPWAPPTRMVLRSPTAAAGSS